MLYILYHNYVIHLINVLSTSLTNNAHASVTIPFLE